MQSETRIPYGSVSGTYKLDDEGSRVEITEHFLKGMSNKNVRKEYRIRHKVSTIQEEQDLFMDFSRRKHEDKGMLDPAFVIEPKRLGEGDYYVVEQYVRIEPLMPESPMASVLEFEKGRI